MTAEGYTVSEALSQGANGQFLGRRRRVTQSEHRQAVDTFIAKSPRPLTAAECDLVRSTWLACAAFHSVADFDGFEEALATLCQEVPVTS